jgi:hypothetical protein
MGKSGNPAKRAEQENPTPVEYDPTPVDADGVEDFDAFWDQQNRKGARVRIMGEVVQLPPAMPLQFQLESQRLDTSEDDDDVRRVVGLLFGSDAIDRWAEAGMDLQQFRVLLAWAPQRIQGGTMSLAEVAARLAEAETEPDPT